MQSAEGHHNLYMDNIPPITLQLSLLVWTCLLCFSLFGCGTPTEVESAEAALLPIEPTYTATPIPITPTPDATATPTLSPTATVLPELALFHDISIDTLSQRAYGGSGIVLGEPLKEEPTFTQYPMSYDSDGLTITGLVNIPVGDGPFPVVILNHGYIIHRDYRAGMDTWLMGLAFVDAGYIALMPDYRNYGLSDNGPNDFRTGYAIDIMNLIEQVSSLEAAAPEQIGIVGHSMGGEVSMWPMVISGEVDAVVLYASMSGDVAKNWAWRLEQWPIQRNAMTALALRYGTPEEAPEGYALVSPETYFDRTRMPVMIHHGTADRLVPYHWSEDMHQKLTDVGVDVELHTYYGAEHTFGGGTFDLFMERNLALFDETVRGNVNTQPCLKRPCQE